MKYIYPKTTIKNDTFIPYKIETNNIDNVRKQLKNTTNEFEQYITQTEYIYRDLIRVEIISDNVITAYYKKQTYASYDNVSKNLYVTYVTHEINDYNFPNLENYNHIENKKIYKYGDILLTYNNFFWTICICSDIDDKTQKILKIIDDII